MRIISGKARGVRLSQFKIKTIRPTLDRVKESLFNQIQPHVKGSYFLDWFAGTGNIGLEAWSRGATKVVFVENNLNAQKTILNNIAKCKADKGIQIFQKDAFQALDLLEKKGSQLDIIYVDPPFNLDLHNTCIQALSESSIIRESTMIIVEHHRKTILKKNYGKMLLGRQRLLGDTGLSFYKPQPFLTSNPDFEKS